MTEGETAMKLARTALIAAALMLPAAVRQCRRARPLHHDLQAVRRERQGHDRDDADLAGRLVQGRLATRRRSTPTCSSKTPRRSANTAARSRPPASSTPPTPCWGYSTGVNPRPQRARQHPLQHAILDDEVVLQRGGDVHARQAPRSRSRRCDGCRTPASANAWSFAIRVGSSNRPKNGVGAP